MDEVSSGLLQWLARDSSGHRPNILIVGSNGDLEAALHGLRLLYADPMATCVLPGPLALPLDGCATLILRNVGALGAAQQAELLQWLESERRVPVVSVNPSPVFDLVAGGAFSDRLYYRLNVIFEDAGALVRRGRNSQDETVGSISH